MNEAVFKASSPMDLAMPLQQAYAEALAEGRGFRLVLPDLECGEFNVSLGSIGGEAIDLRVEGEGGRPATLRGISMSLVGRNIRLRNLILRGARTPASALAVQTVDSFVGERLGFIGICRHDSMSNDPIVQISAMGPRDRNASAVLRECWFLANEGEGFSAVLSNPRTGRAHIRHLLVERCAFLGNRTTVCLDPWFTRKLELNGLFVLENDVDQWLRLRSPMVEVTVSDSFLSCAGTLVEFLTGPDVARNDFPPVASNGCRFMGAAPVSPEDIAGCEGVTGASLPTPADWNDVIRLCQRPPDRDALEALLRG
jgi:hypothetical protein